MELEYKRVEAFEVKGIKFTCASKWNGMEEWVDAEGRKMIVTRELVVGAFSEAFQHLFGASESGKLRVVSASPDLVALLKA